MSSVPDLFVVGEDPANHDALAGLLGGSFPNCAFAPLDALGQLGAGAQASPPALLCADAAGATDMLRACRKTGRTLKIAAYARAPSIGLAVEAMRAGDCDFFTWPLDPETVCRSLRSPQTDMLAARLAAHPLAGVLSAREREVVVAILRGSTSREMAEGLGISFRTVQTYRERLMKKLNVHNVAQLTSKFGI